MEKDRFSVSPETGCSAHECTGLVPAAVTDEEQENLDRLEGIHEPAQKKRCRGVKGRRQK